jgi:hypothetical protein
MCFYFNYKHVETSAPDVGVTFCDPLCDPSCDSLHGQCFSAFRSLPDEKARRHCRSCRHHKARLTFALAASSSLPPPCILTTSLVGRPMSSLGLIVLAVAISRVVVTEPVLTPPHSLSRPHHHCVHPITAATVAVAIVHALGKCFFFFFSLILIVLCLTDPGGSIQCLCLPRRWSAQGCLDGLIFDDTSSAFALCRYICAAYVAVACIREPCWHGAERSWYPSRGTPCKAHVVRYLNLAKCQGKSD